MLISGQPTKDVLIPSHIIWVINKTNQTVTKLICLKCDKENKPVKKSLIFSSF